MILESPLELMERDESSEGKITDSEEVERSSGQESEKPMPCL